MLVNTDIKKVLIPIDFSDTSRKCFYVGLRYAMAFGAETCVLHVKEPITALDSSFEKVEAANETIERIEQGVRRRVEELFGEGGVDEVDRRKVTVAVLAGRPHQQIVRYAIDHEVDLIVMGTHGRTGLTAILVGSVAERVVRLAPCAVLCVKPDGYRSPLDVGAPDHA